MPIANRPTEVKLKIQTSDPVSHTVLVTATEPPLVYRVPSDGRISLTAPSFRHGCNVYLFGAFKVKDATPERQRVIEARRNDRVVCRLSLTQLARLPEDETGHRVIPAGD